MRADVIKRLPGDHTSTGIRGNKTFKIEAVMLDVSNTTILEVYLLCFVVTLNIKVNRTAVLSIMYRLFYVVITTDVLFKKNMNCKYT